MWCFFRFLPIMIGDLVDKDLRNWDCFRKLWNIVQICMAPAIPGEDVAYLQILIQEHHTLFRELYPNASIIPKMHFLIHIPDDIHRYACMIYKCAFIQYLMCYNHRCIGWQVSSDGTTDGFTLWRITVP